MSVSAVDLPVAVRRSRLRRFLRRFPMSARLAALLLIAYVLIALTCPLWAPYDPYEAGTGLPFSGASSSHLFGTDILGRDVFSRVVYGTREVLYLALTSTFIATVIGGVIGLASGLVGGWVDETLMRGFEAIISIPLLMLALLAIAAAGTAGLGQRGAPDRRRRSRLHATHRADGSFGRGRPRDTRLRHRRARAR